MWAKKTLSVLVKKFKDKLDFFLNIETTSYEIKQTFSPILCELGHKTTKLESNGIFFCVKI